MRVTYMAIKAGAGLALLLLLGAGCIQFGSSGPTGPMGVFRSSDKGENWEQANVYPTPQGVKSLAGVKVYRIFTDPSDPNALYLATRGQGLFYTYNAGESWTAVPALAGRFIYALAVDPHDKCTLYVSDGGHIIKSTDCSRTWRIVYTEERPSERFAGVTVDFGNSRTVYGALVGGDILVSTDAGISWKVTKRFGFQIQHVAADPFTARRIYVASYQNGLFRSDDGGVSWRDLNRSLSAFSEASVFYRLVLHPTVPDRLYWVSKYGIVYSVDAGETWTDMHLITPPGSVSIFSFAVNPGNGNELYYVGTLLGDKGVPIRSTFYKSMDGGKSWVTKKMPTDTIPVALHAHPTQSNVLFMGFTNSE